jgi:SAM-dependent methyltransferase
MKFDSEYYEANSQDKDRLALGFYSRIWQRYINSGPILEFGCGVGHLAKRLSRENIVYGFEINEFARSKIAYNAPNVKLMSDLELLGDESLGSVVSLHVLEHIEDDELKKLGVTFNRVLKRNGRLLVVMPNKGGVAHNLKGDRWSAFTDPTHINLKSSKDWRLFFECHWKVKVVKVFADGFYDFPYENFWLKSLLFDAIRLCFTGLQFCLGRSILNDGYGENVVFILEVKK